MYYDSEDEDIDEDIDYELEDYNDIFQKSQDEIMSDDNDMWYKSLPKLQNPDEMCPDNFAFGF